LLADPANMVLQTELSFEGFVDRVDELRKGVMYRVLGPGTLAASGRSD